MYWIEKLLTIVRQSHFNKYIQMLGHPNFQKNIPADDTALHACVTLAFEEDDPTSQHQGRASGPAKGILKIWTALLTNLTKITHN